METTSEKEYFVYMIRCADGSLYSGITTDINRRFAEHVSGGGKGAKYTAFHPPVGVAALWRTDGKSNASKLEYRLKRLSKSDKEKLCLNTFEIGDFIGKDTDCSAYIPCPVPEKLKV